MQVREYIRNRRLYYQGDPSEGIYLVLKGSVRCVKWRDDGTTLILRTCECGQWLALPETLNRGAHLFDAEAVEGSVIGTVVESDIAHLMKNPGFERMLVNDLAGGYYPLHEMLENRSAESRIVHFLLSEMVSRGDSQCVEVTQFEIATLTGLSRETVNKQLRVLKRRGVLSIERGRLVLLDIDALSSLA